MSREGLLLELLLDGNVDDTSGHGHHVVANGAAPTMDRFGNAGGAYLFDGTDDCLVAAPVDLPTRSLSVSLWARVDTLDLGGWSNCLICQDNGDDRDQSRRIFQLSLHCGRLTWHRMTQARDPVSRNVVRPGVWFHAAVTVTNGVHRLYMDGELHDTSEHALRASAEEPIYIGRKGTDEPYFFLHGALDDVRVYERALADDEVRSLFRERGYERTRDSAAAGPISGIWETNVGTGLELRFDGERGVTGAVSAGHPGNVAAVTSGTFDQQTQVLKLAGEARRPDSRAVVHYELEGTLDRDRLTVSYRFGDDRGYATLWRLTPWRALMRRAAAVGRRVGQRVEPFMVPVARVWRGLRRPGKVANLRRLRERGETTASLIFRDASADDIPALAVLHAKTWSATYPGVRYPPTAELRERQWREAFAKADRSWFCIVIENTKGELVGFAKGIMQSNDTGDLNKIYLLGEYQRLGLGRRLVGHVARRFLSSGISSMSLSADAANPSCLFYFALGAVNPRDETGRVHRGWFVWRDLEELAAICPVDPS
jgi:ribosomal protein S18 acetylase RimI-like enzyme